MKKNLTKVIISAILCVCMLAVMVVSASAIDLCPRYRNTIDGYNCTGQLWGNNQSIYGESTFTNAPTSTVSTNYSKLVLNGIIYSEREFANSINVDAYTSSGPVGAIANGYSYLQFTSGNDFGSRTFPCNIAG